MPARPSPLRRQLDKETAAREAAEKDLAEARRQHPLELAALRGDKARRERELRGQLRQARTAHTEAEARAAALAADLEQARADHAAREAELHARVEDGLANAVREHALVVVELERTHAAEVARVSGTEPARRAAAAEQARREAEATLKQSTAAHEAALAGLAEQLDGQRTAYRAELDSAHQQAREAIAEAVTLQGALEQAQATRKALEAKLAPRVPERSVRVRWTRDSPAEGCQVAGRVYRGRGPRTVDRPLRPGFHLVTVEEPGEAVDMPLGAAEALSRSGYITVLAPARDRVYERHQGKTAHDLLMEALTLAAEAQDLADVDQADRERAAQVRAQIVQQYQAMAAAGTV